MYLDKELVVTVRDGYREMIRMAGELYVELNRYDRKQYPPEYKKADEIRINWDEGSIEYELDGFYGEKIWSVPISWLYEDWRAILEERKREEEQAQLMYKEQQKREREQRKAAKEDVEYKQYLRLRRKYGRKDTEK